MISNFNKWQRNESLPISYSIVYSFILIYILLFNRKIRTQTAVIECRILEYVEEESKREREEEKYYSYFCSQNRFARKRRRVTVERASIRFRCTLQLQSGYRIFLVDRVARGTTRGTTLLLLPFSTLSRP